MARRLINIAVHFTIAVLGIAGLYTVYQAHVAYVPPLTFTQPGSIVPSVVKPGDYVQITRMFTVHRPVLVVITRNLKAGNCEVKCVIYDLDSSRSVLDPGNYIRARIHQIPYHIPPGKYTAAFYIQWENSLGRTFSHPLPPIEIEVR